MGCEADAEAGPDPAPRQAGAAGGGGALEASGSVEDALLDISRLFVTAGAEVDLHEVLRSLGEAAGAKRVSLYTLREHGTDAGQLFLFDEADGTPAGQCTATRRTHPDGRAPALETEIVRVAEGRGDLLAKLLAKPSSGTLMPVMSFADRLFGYFDVTYPSQEVFSACHSRLLHTTSYLLASYFERRAHQSVVVAEGDRRGLIEARPEPILVRDATRVLYANRKAAVELLGAAAPREVAGRAFHDLVAEEDHDLVDAQWDRLWSGERSTALVEHEVVRLDGRERVVQSFCLPLVYEGRRAAQVVFHDVTDQRRGEERYRQFLKTTAEGLWCLEVRPPLSTAGETEAHARRLWKRACLVECNTMMAGVLGASEPAALLGRPLGELVRPFMRKVLTEFVRAGYQLHNREVVVPQDDGMARHFVLNAAGTTTRGRLTQICGSCVETTDRIHQEQRMVEALEHQQNAIGRELHDNVGQLLTGVRMLSENLAAQQPEDRAARTRVQRIARLAADASTEISRIYQGLSSQHLYDTALASALEKLARRVDGLSAGGCSFRCDEEALSYELSHEVKLQLYRIAQEAVNNAVKHARSGHIRVRLVLRREAGRPARLVLRVQDDGSGFDPAHAGGEDSLGLHSMRYRAQAVGGTLAIDAAPGEGATVTCTLPVETSGNKTNGGK